MSPWFCTNTRIKYTWKVSDKVDDNYPNIAPITILIIGPIWERVKFFKASSPNGQSFFFFFILFFKPVSTDSEVYFLLDHFPSRTCLSKSVFVYKSESEYYLKENIFLSLSGVKIREVKLWFHAVSCYYCPITIVFDWW